MAGLIATHGGPMLWYPVEAAAGFVIMLAPLRRSGSGGGGSPVPGWPSGPCSRSRA
ncbi:hypothetical protein ACIBHX_11590 [Nonomuraea sp. NPDC050536]|uniref:hypothetical protein n=1 Tax=Nonomuraea sp. NPDC050536 TaxID=3364366 RepID=UPI0037C5FF60